jgi:integrase
VTIKGKQVLLAKGRASRADAYRRFAEIVGNAAEAIANGTDQAPRASVKAVCSLFIEHASLHLKPSTVDGYRRFIEPFAKEHATLDANLVQPRHVTKFLNTKSWNKTTWYNAITAIKRAWSWAKDEGHLTLNQLQPMRRPKPEVRTAIPTDAEIDQFIAAATPSFRQFLVFMRETGCRPGEAAMVERRYVDLGSREVRFPLGMDKTSGKTGKPRVIHLNDAAFAIVSGPVHIYPHGLIFRDSRGKKWTKFSINHATINARKKAGLHDMCQWT